MLSFPSLRSGATAQYPLGLTEDAAVQVIRFLDGTDQRFQSRGKLLRRWKIDLTALTEDEIGAVEAFFNALGGAYMKFSFSDPVSGDLIPNCILYTEELLFKYMVVDCPSTSL